MTITIVEDLSRFTTEQKYSQKAEKRAFKCGDIWTVSSQGLDRYPNNGRNALWLSQTCRYLSANGFLLSEELKKLYEKEVAREKARSLEIEQKLVNKKAEATQTGKPVVVSATPYQTTASVGRNYDIALPNGDIVTVTNGCPTSSYSTRVGTSNHDTAIQEAIATYHNH